MAPARPQTAREREALLHPSRSRSALVMRTTATRRGVCISIQEASSGPPLPLPPKSPFSQRPRLPQWCVIQERLVVKKGVLGAILTKTQPIRIRREKRGQPNDVNEFNQRAPCGGNKPEKKRTTNSVQEGQQSRDGNNRSTSNTTLRAPLKHLEFVEPIRVSLKTLSEAAKGKASRLAFVAGRTVGNAFFMFRKGRTGARSKALKVACLWKRYGEQLKMWAAKQTAGLVQGPPSLGKQKAAGADGILRDSEPKNAKTSPPKRWAQPTVMSEQRQTLQDELEVQRELALYLRRQEQWHRLGEQWHELAEQWSTVSEHGRSLASNLQSAQFQGYRMGLRALSQLQGVQLPQQGKGEGLRSLSLLAAEVGSGGREVALSALSHLRSQTQEVHLTLATSIQKWQRRRRVQQFERRLKELHSTEADEEYLTLLEEDEGRSLYSSGETSRQGPATRSGPATSKAHAIGLLEPSPHGAPVPGNREGRVPRRGPSSRLSPRLGPTPTVGPPTPPGSPWDVIDCREVETSKRLTGGRGYRSGEWGSHSPSPLFFGLGAQGWNDRLRHSLGDGIARLLLAQAVTALLKSKVDSCTELSVDVDVSATDLLLGRISSIQVSAKKAVYKGLSLSGIELLMSSIRLGQLLGGNHSQQSMHGIPLDLKVRMTEEDLGRSFSSPLLVPALRELCSMGRQEPMPTFQVALREGFVDLQPQAATKPWYPSNEEPAAKTSSSSSNPEPREQESRPNWWQAFPISLRVPSGNKPQVLFDLNFFDSSGLPLAVEQVASLLSHVPPIIARVSQLKAPFVFSNNLLPQAKGGDGPSLTPHSFAPNLPEFCSTWAFNSMETLGCLGDLRPLNALGSITASLQSLPMTLTKLQVNWSNPNSGGTEEASEGLSPLSLAVTLTGDGNGVLLCSYPTQKLGSSGAKKVPWLSKEERIRTRKIKLGPHTYLHRLDVSTQGLVLHGRFFVH